MKKIIIILFIGILIGSISSIALYLTLSKPPEEAHTSSHITLEKVEQVAKLITVEYYMVDIVTYQNDKIWPFSDEKILVVAKAKILAGFNLLNGINVTVTEKTDANIPSQKPHILITLPTPQIISIQPDYRYYDIQGNPPPDAHSYVLNLAKVSLWDAAKQEGILEEAKSSVVKQMQQLFMNADLEIRFQDQPQEVKNENS